MKYKSVIISIVLALMFRVFLISVYKVPSQSMAPVVLAGDFVLASQISYGFKFLTNNEVYFSNKPKINDLVIYTKNAKTFIKRVMAIAGDEIEYIDGEFIINSVKCSYTGLTSSSDRKLVSVDEKCGLNQHQIYRPLDLAQFSQNIVKTKLGENQFLVAGDNRSFESNPNSVEITSYDQIVGKPVLIWMSYSSTQDFISNTLGVRWNRILTKVN